VNRPELRVAVLEKALEFALSSPPTTAAQLAVQALDTLEGAAPDRKDDWTVKRADILRAKYRCSRGEAEKKKAAEKLLDGLLAAASVCEKRGNWTGAAAQYRRADPLAVYLKHDRAGEIGRKLKTATHLAKVAQKARHYANALKKNPAKALTRELLIKTVVVELNDPAGAIEHLNEDADEAWRIYVPLACKPLDKLTETVCKDLGDWYYKALARTSSAAARPVMLARAKRYYQRFLTLHSKADVPAVAVRAALAAMQKEKTETGPFIAAGSFINLFRSLDVSHLRSSGWTMKSGVLRLNAGAFSKLTLPWMPEGSYEFKVAFVRTLVGEVVLMFPVGGSATIFSLGAVDTPYLHNAFSTYEYSGVSGMGKLVNGKEYTIKITAIP
jgi:hypothetical protein